MRFFDLLGMSISNLWKRKLRTVLTVLGVVIGVTSIVVMVALGNGLKESMLESFESYSSITQIRIYQGRNYNSSGEQTEEKLLSDAVVEEISNMEHVVSVMPLLEVQALAKTGKYMGWLNLRGVTKEELADLKLEFAQGGMPDSDTQLQLIYGNSVLTDFYIEKSGTYVYWDTGKAPDIDLMEDVIYLIFDTDAYWNSKSGSSGTEPVKPPKKYLSQAAGVMAGKIDEWSRHSSSVYCNIDALKLQLHNAFKKKQIPGQPTRKNGKPYNEIFYSSLTVQVDDMKNVQELTNMLNNAGYNAQSDMEWIQSNLDQMNTIQAVLGAIGAVAMLVAAISITNTMMMSIYERTKEIGVMKVIGCNIRNIQALFLLEAGFIGFLGGIIGLLFSYGLSFVINKLLASGMADMIGSASGNICRIPLWLAPAAIGFAIVIGMVAGFIPSLRAMRLSPLAAIRNE